MEKKLIIFVGIFLALVAVFFYPTEFDVQLLRGKNVLITGASSGIGRQLAYLYCKHDANLVITARRANNLLEVIKECKLMGSKSNIHYVIADMTKEESYKRLIDETTVFLGGLDQLILNHGVLDDPFIWGSERSLDNLKKTWLTNTFSHAAIAGYALPHLKRSKGSIGVTNSIFAKINVPYMTTYATSKYALEGFFSSLRLELLSYDVSVTTCFIGAVESEMQEKFSKNTAAADEKNSDLMSEPTFKNLQRIFSGKKPAKSDDAAYAIMQSVSLRKNDMAFPTYYTYTLPFSGLLNKLISYRLQ